MESRPYDTISVGDTGSLSKTISETDVYLFAGITGDFNPAHINAVEAENGLFKKRVAHGVLSAGLISAVIGTDLPGKGTIYLAQSLSFQKPVYIGDTITAVVTVREKLERRRLLLDTACYNQKGELVSRGSSTVMAPAGW